MTEMSTQKTIASFDFDYPPFDLTFDVLLSGEWGEVVNYIEKYGVWQVLLSSGWFYTASIGMEIASRCSAIERLDQFLRIR